MGGRHGYKCVRCGYATLVRSNMRGSPAGAFTCRGTEVCDKRFENRVKHGRELIERCERDLRRDLSPGEQRDLLKDNTDWHDDTVATIVELLNRREAA